MSAPRLVVVLELEHTAFAYADVPSESEERRLLCDLDGRDVPHEVMQALAQLLDGLEAA